MVKRISRISNRSRYESCGRSRRLSESRKVVREAYIGGYDEDIYSQEDVIEKYGCRIKKMGSSGGRFDEAEYAIVGYIDDLERLFNSGEDRTYFDPQTFEYDLEESTSYRRSRRLRKEGMYRDVFDWAMDDPDFCIPGADTYAVSDGDLIYYSRKGNEVSLNMYIEDEDDYMSGTNYNARGTVEGDPDEIDRIVDETYDQLEDDLYFNPDRVFKALCRAVGLKPQIHYESVRRNRTCKESTSYRRSRRLREAGKTGSILDNKESIASIFLDNKDKFNYARTADEIKDAVRYLFDEYGVDTPVSRKILYNLDSIKSYDRALSYIWNVILKASGNGVISTGRRYESVRFGSRSYRLVRNEKLNRLQIRETR